MRKTLRLVLALALLLCAFKLDAQRAPEFRTEQLNGAKLTFIIDEHHFPYDVSDNGKHVAIQGYGDYPSYYWSEETGLISMDNGYAFAVSDDGVVAGYYLDATMGESGINVAGLWNADTEAWSFIGMNPAADGYTDAEYNGAWAMTNDGSTLAIMQYDGSWDTHTYTWNETDGYTLLPHGSTSGSRPNAISADGNVVAGRGVSSTTGGWFACYWVDGEFYNFNEEIYGEAKTVSPNGNYIAGYNGNNRIFVYNRELDELTVVDDSDPNNTYSATYVTDDGVVFGYVVDVFPPYAEARRAVVYTDGELISFNDYLLMQGIEEAAEWTIYSVNSVTTDGMTFTGAANIDGNDYTFIMTVEEPACQGPKALAYNIDRINNHDDIVLTWKAPEDATDNVTYDIYESYTSETPLVEGITETTYTFVDMLPGTYSFVVRANNGDCLSPFSNIVRPFVDPCSAADQCTIQVLAQDTYGDGWNYGYIEVTGEDSGITYKVEMKSGMTDSIVLSLCPDAYTFKWVAGSYDDEVAFIIYKDEEEIYNQVELGEPEAGVLFKYALDCSEPVELPSFVELISGYDYPYDISDNKKHVVIQTFEAVSYYWSIETGAKYIDGLAFSVSNDGIVAGYYLDKTNLVYLAGLWDPSTEEWTFLGELEGKEIPTTGTADMPADYNGAWAMTNDGSTVAVQYIDSLWNTFSYLWTEDDGYVQLTNGTSQSTRPSAISNDARVVAGHGVADLGWTICYWIDGVFYEVPNYYGEALAVSSSGNYVSGFVDSGEGIIINTATHEMELITSSTIEGAFKATCVNNKGEAFGFYADAAQPVPSTRNAFAYIGGQVITFNEYLMLNGYTDAQNWRFYTVNAITADGRSFLCSVNIDGEDCSAIVTIPVAECKAPSNLTYTIDDKDYSKVILSWTAPKNADGVTYEIYDDLMSDTPLYSGITETTFAIEGLEPGEYNFMVRANCGDCLSLPTNGVKPIIYPCVEQDKCELNLILQDYYADGWNTARIEIRGTKSNIVYTVEIGHSQNEQERTLMLCPDTYTFTWIQGTWDEECGFAIYFGEEELYSVGMGKINEALGDFLVYNLDCGTGVEEMSRQDIISIMPNPAKEYFNITGIEMLNVEVYNAIGQKIDAVNVDNDNVQISTSKYEEGVYFIKINTAHEGVVVRKVVVTK